MDDQSKLEILEAVAVVMLATICVVDVAAVVLLLLNITGLI